ncbi:hypothetical protein ACP4OV_002047 [Aristida adscensionis]
MDSGGGGGDRLSGLSDAVLGHILSFLPAAEAARAAALSRRWRDVFAYVHTVAFEEKDRPVRADGDEEDDARGGWCGLGCCSPFYGGGGDDDDMDSSDSSAPALPFVTAVGAALLGRRRGPRVAGAPLRALRVAPEVRRRQLRLRAGGRRLARPRRSQRAGDELHVDLRFGHARLCGRGYSIRPGNPDDDDMERLSLFFLPELCDLDYLCRNRLRYGHRDDVLAVPEVKVRCLRKRTRRIDLVHYKGDMAQRTMAKFLLRNAPVVDEVCCVFAPGRSRLRWP